jgi:hypothetical protein
MQFVQERDAYAIRKCSMEIRANFAKNLHSGEDCVAVYCGERDPVGYWIARCEASSKQSQAVVYTAKKDDDGWDIKKGEDVLNVTWMKRVSADRHLEHVFSSTQTITLNSILPVKAVWDKMHGNTSYLREECHYKIMGWYESVRGDLIKERNTLASEATKAAVMGDKTAPFSDLPPTLQLLTLMRAVAMSSYVAASAAFDAACAVRKMQAAVLDEDEMPLEVVRTIQRKRQHREQHGSGTRTHSQAKIKKKKQKK